MVITCLFPFLSTGIKFTFLQSLGKIPSLRQLLNNKESGFITEGPQTFSIPIDILPSPWALLEFKPCVNFSIFFESLSMVLSLLEVSKVWVDGRVLLFGRDWHCLLKKSLKILALSLKLSHKFVLTNIGGITSLFLTNNWNFLPLTRVWLLTSMLLMKY